jgi:hypothetical protein
MPVGREFMIGTRTIYIYVQSLKLNLKINCLSDFLLFQDVQILTCLKGLYTMFNVLNVLQNLFGITSRV